jgi:nucleotide-binding universal stress UspA family protein
MKRIALLTDFSETARNAAAFAIEMFSGEKVQFFLINSFDVEFSGSPYIMQVKEEIMEESLKGLKRELSELHARFPNARIELASRYGPLVDVIIKEYLDDGIEPDLIVLGCRGESAIENFLLGSNAYDVIKNINKPLMVIPRNAKYRLPNKMVFATDLKAIDENAALPLLDLVKTFNSELLFVNVIEEEYINRLEAEEKIALLFPDVKMSFHFVDNEDVCEGVCSFTDENNADIIVLVRHNYSFFERLFHPSVTKKMVLHPQFPMIILHT